MKRIIVISLLMVLVLSTTTVLAESNHPFYGNCWCTEHLNGTAPYVPGDSDRDGKVGAADAMQILRACVGLIPSSNPVYTTGQICPSFLVMDVDGDGHINAVDALEVLKYVVGKVDEFAR